ncbi:staygreen family protein [Clostridium sp. AL.422]|uniref:staygreen family protein n=1 Tax=Clostridium TaxID=1485 RepID=UPI00293DA463|nr:MULTISPECIES: staygreen family protein [unclassified Clostridium]MDV4149565.1 staygreen family protein [Clostridium sp. AL.422]
MSNTNLYKLKIERSEDILDDGPIIPRCYEVTYSKASNEMKVVIDKDESKSIEVYRGNGLCGRWCYENDKYMLFFQVSLISNKKDYEKAKEKDKSIREEIPFMLNSIIKAEEEFLERNKGLYDAEIFIKFNCLYDDFYKVENWGYLRNYSDIQIDDEKKIREKELKNQLYATKNQMDIYENIILNLLKSNIETQLFPIYGSNIRFLIRDMTISNIRELEQVTGTDKEYEMVISISLLNGNQIDEVLLNARVSPNGIIIQKIP